METFVKVCVPKYQEKHLNHPYGWRKVTSLKFLELCLNYPPLLEKFMKASCLKCLGKPLNHPPWLRKSYFLQMLLNQSGSSPRKTDIQTKQILLVNNSYLFIPQPMLYWSSKSRTRTSTNESGPTKLSNVISLSESQAPHIKCHIFSKASH